METALESCSAEENVFDCMRKKTWQREDIVTNASKGYDIFEQALVETKYWTQQFLNGYWACQTFILDQKIGTDANRDEIFFHLNRSMLYAYYIHAPDYFIQNYNPLALANNYGKLFPAKVVMMAVIIVLYCSVLYMTDTHHGGNLSAMIMVGGTKSHH